MGRSVLSAYIHRLRTGEGQFVDISLLESGVAYTVWETAILFAMGEVAGPTGSRNRMAAPYEALPTADGHITVGAGNQRIWKSFCAAIGREDLLADERFSEPLPRVRNREALAEELRGTLLRETSETWLHKLQQARVPCGPIYDMEQVYNDPQVQARQMLVDVEHPRANNTKQIGMPVKLSRTPAEVERPSPILGQHTRQVLGEYSFSREEIQQLLEARVVEEAASAEQEAAE